MLAIEIPRASSDLLDAWEIFSFADEKLRILSFLLELSQWQTSSLATWCLCMDSVEAKVKCWNGQKLFSELIQLETVTMLLFSSDIYFN